VKGAGSSSGAVSNHSADGGRAVEATEVRSLDAVAEVGSNNGGGGEGEHRVSSNEVADLGLVAGRL
jgi:hypothetical protein